MRGTGTIALDGAVMVRAGFEWDDEALSAAVRLARLTEVAEPVLGSRGHRRACRGNPGSLRRPGAGPARQERAGPVLAEAAGGTDAVRVPVGAAASP